MNNLRLTLLSGIIGSSGISYNKYTNSFNSLKAVIKLEHSEKKDKLPKYMFEEFDKLENIKDNLNKKFSGIPLLILEQYFFRNSKTLDAEIYIEYEHKNINAIITELYILLEDYFFKMYLLAVEIADFYNLEIKIKKDTQSKTEYL